MNDQIPPEEFGQPGKRALGIGDVFDLERRTLQPKKIDAPPPAPPPAGDSDTPAGDELDSLIGRDPPAERDERERSHEARSGSGRKKGADFSEDRLALILAERHERALRYVALWGKWLAWAKTHWQIENTLAVFDEARKICREAGFNRAKEVAAVETLARSDRRMAATTDQWDADPDLLNAGGVLIDLKNGEGRPVEPSDYCMKMNGAAAADPGAACPLWLDFLHVVMGGDQDLIDYLQGVCGYCLTGSTKEHALFFLYGTGANGKSVFVNTLRSVFGSYHATAPIESFTVTHGMSHPTDLAGLMGARLVTVVETEEGRPWAEAKIKTVTGGDEQRARFMRQDFFSFTPTFKLMIAGNHKPRLKTVDEAMRRRFHLIPFAVTIAPEDRDKDLADKLKSESGAILRWMIDGTLKWRNEGLNPPQAVIDATNKYLEAEDSLASWIEDRCECKASFQDTSASLFASWKAWCELMGEEVGSQKRFSERLEAIGLARIRIGKACARGHQGLRVIKLNDPPTRNWGDHD
jgi:putative DNA primase/helicase